MPVPYRSGLPSLRLLLPKVCGFINKFREKWEGFMTPTQIAAFEELYTNCMTCMSIINELLGYN